MSPHLVTYASWQEVRGEWPTAETVKASIRRFNKLSALVLLVRINVMLAVDRFRGGPEDTIKLQQFFANNFIDGDLLLDLMARYGPERLDNRVIFHPQQVLTL